MTSRLIGGLRYWMAHWKLIVAVALAFLAVGSIFTALLFRSNKAALHSDVTHAQISVEPAKQVGTDWVLEEQRGLKRPSRTALALSPDGKILVYGGLGERGCQLFTRAMNAWNAVPLTGTEGGRDPFFSPDGQWVGFWADRQWKKVPISGGLSVEICAAPEIPRGASWGASNSIVFADYDKLWRVSASGGKSEALIAVSEEKGEKGFLLPHFLPGAEVIVFSVVTSNDRWANPRIEALVLNTRERKVIIEEGADARHSPSGHLLFARRGTLFAVAFDVKRLSTTGVPVPVASDIMQAMNALHGDLNSYAAQEDFSTYGTLAYIPGGPYPDPQRVIAEVDFKGTPRRLTAVVKPYYFPRISPNGRHLVYTTQGKEGNTFIHDLERDTDRRLTLGKGTTWHVWAPDGKRLAFVSDESDRKIFLAAADDGHKPELLVEAKNGVTPSSFSPDGSLLAFVEQKPETRSDISICQITGRQIQSFLASPYSEMHPTFSPDGRYLAYTSDETGRNEVYVRLYPGPGGTVTISRDGGWGPIWSPDGRRLYFATLDRKKLMAVDVVLHPRFSAGNPTLLFDHKGMYIMPGIPVRDFDLTPDGRHFIFCQSVDSEPVGATQINIVLNWFEELKRLCPTGK